MSERVAAITYGGKAAGVRRYHRVHRVFPSTRGACGVFVNGWADRAKVQAGGIPPCQRCYPGETT